MNEIEALLRCAARSVTEAARACRAWEDTGDGDTAADTAWEAKEATSEALEAAACMEPGLASLIYPETRLGRLVLAARLLVLAGSDEGGRSGDLKLAADLLLLAAEA